MGKLHLLSALYFASLTLQVQAVNLDGTYPRDYEAELHAIRRAEGLDPMGNRKLKKALPGARFAGKEYKAIRLEGGLQLHPSCEREASRSAISREDFTKKMNQLMSTMMSKIIKCIDNYPEMKSYLLESISQFRRQTLRCEPTFGQKGLIKPIHISGSYSAYNDGKSITLAGSVLESLLYEGREGEDWAISTVFHELLHSTTCNNRHDHNEIETIPVTEYDSKTCNDNVTMDRISVVESLCMGGGLNSSDKTATLLLAQRMNMCGSDRGCRDMFTAKGNSHTFLGEIFGINFPNKDLDDNAANRICQRIKDDGMCLHFRNTQGPTITRSNPKVVAIREKMQKRLSEIMPDFSNKLSTDWIAIYPDLDKRFKTIKDGKCFKRNFYIPEDKPHEINSFRTTANTVSDAQWEKDDKGIPNRVVSIAKDLDNFLKNSSSDECDKDNQEIKSILEDLGQRLDEGQASNTLRRMFKLISETKYPQFEPLMDSYSDARKILGHGLVEEYLDTMNKFHYQSPDFDCMAAGLAPFRIMENAVKKTAPLCE